MARDRKITALCAITMLAAAFGHELMSLYAWVGLTVALGLVLLTMLAWHT